VRRTAKGLKEISWYKPGNLKQLNQAHPNFIFLLNNQQAVGAKATFIKLAHILYLVKGKLHGTALALGE
jgi:hypothetical protein